MRRPRFLRLVGTLALLAGILFCAPQTRAQYATSIPLDAWTSNYQSFVYPIIPNNPSLPNAARYTESAGGPNQLNRYYGQVSNNFNAYMEGLPPGAPDVRGRMIPYTSAYRRYDREYDRVYQPNRDVDSRFYEERAQRDDLFFQTTSATTRAQRAAASRKLQEFERKHPTLGGRSRRLQRPPAPSAARRRSSADETPAPTPQPERPTTPTFTNAFGGALVLSPYANRGRLSSANIAAPSTGPSLNIPPAPGLSASPDEVLERSQRMNDMNIPPAPDPHL